MRQLPPQLHAMLLCDRSFQQAQTGKWCVIGTQSALLAPQLPIFYPLSVFVSVGDLRHGARFEVEVRDPRDELLIQAEAEVQHQPGEELNVSGIDLGWQFPTLKLGEHGPYLVRIKAAGQPLAERRLEVCEHAKHELRTTEGPCELQALLLCDAAFQHHGSPSWTLIGIHNAILVPDLPAAHAPFVVFFSLRDFRGDAIVMATVRDNEGSVVFAVRAQIPHRNAEIFEMAFPFPPVAFRRAGSHMIELHVGEQLLAVKSFFVQVHAKQ